MSDEIFDAVVNFDDVIDDPEKLTQAFEQAAEQGERRLWDNSEWTEQQFISLKDIITAFMVGTLRADEWFGGYSLPPNFETVINALSRAVETKFGKDEFIKASLLDLEAFYREFIDASPLCREWNDFPGGGFVTRYSKAPSERTSIGLDALVRNAAIYIRDDRREFDRFNSKFEAEHGSLV